MAEDRQSRIDRLSQRFKTHVAGRKPSAQRSRARHSFYLDTDLVEKLDRIYRDVNHDLHPAVISKSEFLETLLDEGLSHVADVKAILKTVADTHE